MPNGNFDFKPILTAENCVIRADFHPKFNKNMSW